MRMQMTPMRKCVGCGEVQPKEKLVRIVRKADGTGFLLDESKRANGRGAYLCRNAECLAKAKKRHALERSLSGKVPEEVFDALKEALGG